MTFKHGDYIYGDIGNVTFGVFLPAHIFSDLVLICSSYNRKWPHFTSKETWVMVQPSFIEQSIALMDLAFEILPPSGVLRSIHTLLQCSCVTDISRICYRHINNNRLICTHFDAYSMQVPKWARNLLIFLELFFQPLPTN